MLDALRQALESFVEIGLGYLSLDRATGTLSGGEAQRTKLIRHLGSSLTDVTYVFDEPTVGLHPHDIQRMNDLLLQLRDKGNTVLVVEHKPEVIEIADHVVDLGPGAGAAGGQVVFEGTVAGLRRAGTLTGRHLGDRAALKPSVRESSAVLQVRGADLHNLQDVDVDIPLGVLVVVTGVAGSGKSSLIHGSVSGRDGVVAIDQGAIRGSRRSNPATYSQLPDPSAWRSRRRTESSRRFSAGVRQRLPELQRRGRHGTDRAMMAEWRLSARSAAGSGSTRRCSTTRRRPGHQRGAGDPLGQRRRGVLRCRRRPARRPPTPCAPRPATTAGNVAAMIAAESRMRRDERRFKSVSTMKAAEQGLRRHPGECQRREAGRACRCATPPRAAGEQDDADDERQRPVRELDGAVMPSRARDERRADAARPGRAAEAGAGEPDRAAGDHDADANDDDSSASTRSVRGDAGQVRGALHAATPACDRGRYPSRPPVPRPAGRGPPRRAA